MQRDNISTQRSSLLQKNILASFLIKGWSALIVLLLVPVTLHCLGEYKNGIWLTISSLLLWIDNMDIGLGNGLRNKIAEYMAHNEVTRASLLRMIPNPAARHNKNLSVCARQLQIRLLLSCTFGVNMR